MEVIKNYFNAEKAESLLFIGFGILAISLSVYFFFFLKESFWKGLAIPLVFFSFAQIVIGTTIFTRSPKDNLRVEKILKYEPQKIQTKELPRMEKVRSNFVIYRYVEIILLLAGLVLFFYFKNNVDKSFWVGLGLTLAIEAAVSLGADYFAEERAKVYTQGLKEFTHKFNLNSYLPGPKC